MGGRDAVKQYIDFFPIALIQFNHMPTVAIEIGADREGGECFGLGGHGGECQKSEQTAQV